MTPLRTMGCCTQKKEKEMLIRQNQKMPTTLVKTHCLLSSLGYEGYGGGGYLRRDRGNEDKRERYNELAERFAQKWKQRTREEPERFPSTSQERENIGKKCFKSPALIPTHLLHRSVFFSFCSKSS